MSFEKRGQISDGRSCWRRLGEKCDRDQSACCITLQNDAKFECNRVPGGKRAMYLIKANTMRLLHVCVARTSVR